MKHKFIFVVGGVLSGVGKGTTTASIGLLLKDRGYKVTAMKIDPYLNIDAGTMNPVEHGEVYVTKDGLECDQDLGNYERFIDLELTRENYMTAGQVFQTVLDKERALHYGGKCVEMVPHIPDEILSRIHRAAEKDQADVTLVEVGGTVGEYQNMLFLEAARLLKLKQPHDVVFVLVSYLPVPPSIGEMKTKPTQYAVRSLNAVGIQPDFIVARSEHELDDPRKEKMSIHCNVTPDCIIPAPNVESIYEVPLNFSRVRFTEKILEKLGLEERDGSMTAYRELVARIKTPTRAVKIAVVGKYFGSGGYILKDAYISIIESIKHAAWHFHARPDIEWLHAEHFDDGAHLDELKHVDGILIPGGFGARGIQGKLNVIQYAREHNIPLFGICYGMQLMVIETARNILKLRDAHTTEIDETTTHPVVHILPEQEMLLHERNMGGTMRLGSYPCQLEVGSKAQCAYGREVVEERHRHRYEVNTEYEEQLVQAGLRFSGRFVEKNLPEIVEHTTHPFFVGVQFHPEFQTSPLKPHPLFRAFVESALYRTK